jgi:adenylate cyclase
VTGRPAAWEREWRTLAWFGLSNLLGASVVFVYLAFLSEPVNPSVETGVLVVGFGGFMLFSLPLGFVLARRAFRPVRRWLEEGRPPTEEEREATIRIPRAYGRISFGIWLAAVVFFGAINFVLGESVRETLRSGVGTLLGGVATSALALLLVERSLRPVFSDALAGEPRTGRGPGVRRRLLLTWFLGSGIPLLGIAMIPVGDDTDLASAVSLAVIGLGAGLLFTIVSARSVADRLTGLRTAVARVQDGDVEVEVPVDDAGEVGRLQAGFNAMVEGLRERQRLQDLFGRHVGEDVARLALERGGPVAAEQREASILFVDVIGSTGLAATRPATEVVAMLNALFEAVVATAAAERGWVNKFEGDGAMCVWGAPLDQPDHAARALRAAVALRGQVRVVREVHPDLDVGIGVSTGPVVAGNVGAAERYEYTVIGDPVNEAARLTELAKERPSRLLASESSVRAAGDEARCWQPAGTVTLRGRTEPTVVYEPLVSEPARPAPARR